MIVKSNSSTVGTMGAFLLVTLLTTITAAPLIQTSDHGDPANVHYLVHPFETTDSPRGDGTREGHYTGGGTEGGVTPKGTPDTTEDATIEPEDKDQLTSWSIAWYLILLAAFIIFFILIGLTEIFCRHHAREDRWHRARRERARNSREPSVRDSEAPPPYDLFKPPSYSTLFPLDSAKCQQKNQEATQPKQLVYVVAVHGGRGVS